MATINSFGVRPGVQLAPRAVDLYAEVDRLSNLIRQKQFEDHRLVRPAVGLPALKELLRGENGSDPITKLFYATCILEQSPDDEEALLTRLGSKYRYWPEQRRDFARFSTRPPWGHTHTISPYLLVELQASKCDFRSSLATLNTSLTFIKRNERHLYLLQRSFIHFALNRRDESLKDFKEAAECSPWQEPLRQAIKDGNFSEALKHLDGAAAEAHLCLLLFGDDTLRARLLPQIKRNVLPSIFKYIALHKEAPRDEQAFLLFLRDEFLQRLAPMTERRAADAVARGTKRPAEAVVQPPPAQRIETETPLSRLQALEGEFRSGCTLERANAMLPLVEAITYGELFVRCTELKMRLLMHCNKYEEARLLAGPILGQDIADTVRQKVHKMLLDIAVLKESS